MTAAELVAKLMVIERAVGCLEPARLKAMLAEAQDGLLELEWAVDQLTRENQEMHLRLVAIRAGEKGAPAPRRREPGELAEETGMRRLLARVLRRPPQSSTEHQEMAEGA